MPALGSPAMPLSLYKPLVRSFMQRAREVSLKVEFDKHKTPFAYVHLVSSSTCASQQRVWKRMQWEELTGHSCLCKLRAGLYDLRHVNRRKSIAGHAKCILCMKPVRCGYVHMLTACPSISRDGLPVEWGRLEARDAARLLLTSVPGHAHFLAVVRIAVEIDRRHREFWQ